MTGDYLAAIRDGMAEMILPDGAKAPDFTLDFDFPLDGDPVTSGAPQHPARRLGPDFGPDFGPMPDMEPEAEPDPVPAPVPEPVLLAAPDLSCPAGIDGFAALCRATLDDAATGALVIDLGAPLPATALPPDLLAAAADVAATEAALSALVAVLTGAGKPVVARLAGTVAGPAATVALAAELRVAGPSLRFGFPEHALGLLPMGGALRLAAARCGAGPTLEAVLSGQLIGHQAAQQAGFIEIATSFEPASAEIAARRLMEEGGAAMLQDRCAALADPETFLAQAAAARQGPLAPLAEAAIDGVEAALLLPAPAADEIGAEALAGFARMPQAAALLRHARNRARDALAGPVPATVALVGATPATAEIAARLLAADVAVTLCDPDLDRLRLALEAVAGLQDRAVDAGTMTAAARDLAWSQIGATLDPATLADIEIALSATPEAEAEIGRLLPEGPVRAVLAAVPGTIAALCPSLGAEGGSLVEILPGLGPEATLPRLAGLAEALGAAAVVLPEGRAAASVRLRVALWRAAADCLALGAAPAALDDALARAGIGCAPVAAARALGPRALAARIAAMGPARGRFPEPGFAPLFRAGAAAEGAEAPADAAQAAEACLAALANEGARMLADGCVGDAATLDLVACAALRITPEIGGPMLWAERLGGRSRLLAARNLLRDRAGLLALGLGETAAAFWEPAPAWEAGIRAGKGF
ncbi:enoyl-CoA hydratase-related protein [Frigidibacter sp. MR17.24]|uniref:enoyl-CoA hydratase-related protein n=1 Tax=Frigidibacter sp. MR17.24 TaxID=3127345 RepID=UPI003012A4FA